MRRQADSALGPSLTARGHTLRDCGGAEATSRGRPDEIRLFSKCRNERLRLPAFLRHYRELGVGTFFIVDNGSTDGSAEFLRSQPDVRLFQTDGSFREARGGTDWLNALLSSFGVGHWCVTVDMDELLCYPGYETSSLPELTAHLDSQGNEAMSCMLLDMYPSGALRDCGYTEGSDLLDAAPYFDPSPYNRIPGAQCPDVLIYGGVRERIFFPESYARDFKRKVHVGLYYRLLPKVPAFGDIGWVRARRPFTPPCLTKVPLVRWDENTTYLNVNHFVSPKRVAPETGVLLHFKLLQDFHERAMVEAVRGAYFDGSVEYRRYASRLRTDPGLNLMYADSTRFDGSGQLVRLGIIQDTPEWSRQRAGGASLTTAAPLPTAH